MIKTVFFKTMKFEEIYDQVGKYALMSRFKARTLYRFIMTQKPMHVLEMGCHQGGSALIMAAALEELGQGHITTFDFPDIAKLKPNAESLLLKTHLAAYVDLVYCDWCCEWELAKLMEANVKHSTYRPYVDFVYLDGGHYWTATGFAFYLATNLLKPGGWVLLDDLDWVIASDEIDNRTYKKRISREAQKRPMVQMIFDLIVKTHPAYENFHLSANRTWGWAQKRR
jgi:predicted O-methyltransferase YrrM